MIKSLGGTVLSKGLSAVLNILIISIAGRELGIEAVGTISLIVLGITIIMLVNNFIGGGAITYLVAQFPIRSLLLPSYAWAILTAFAGLGIVLFFDLVPVPYQIHVVALAFIESLFTVHLAILLGKKKLALHNALHAGQVIILFIVFYALMRSGTKEVMHYITASYVAFSVNAIISGIYVLNMRDERMPSPMKEVLTRMAAQGGFIQLANVFQLLTYRFNYFLIERFLGLGPLGNYSIGTQLSEGSWLVPKSIGTVLYMKVSNEADAQARTALTLALMHLAMISSALVVLFLFLIPQSVYSFVFGAGATGISTIVLYLTPGIVAMAGAQALSHYFSGTGANHRNTIASGLAMLITVTFGLILVPQGGLKAAASVASISFSALYAYQLWVFCRENKIKMGQLIPNLPALRRIVRLLSE